MGSKWVLIRVPSDKTFWVVHSDALEDTKAVKNLDSAVAMGTMISLKSSKSNCTELVKPLLYDKEGKQQILKSGKPLFASKKRCEVIRIFKMAIAYKYSNGSGPVIPWLHKKFNVSLKLYEMIRIKEILKDLNDNAYTTIKMRNINFTCQN